METTGGPGGSPRGTGGLEDHHAVFWVGISQSSLLVYHFGCIHYSGMAVSKEYNWDYQVLLRNLEKFTNPASCTLDFVLEFIDLSLQGKMNSDMNACVLELKLNDVQLQTSSLKKSH